MSAHRIPWAEILEESEDSPTPGQVAETLAERRDGLTQDEAYNWVEAAIDGLGTLAECDNDETAYPTVCLPNGDNNRGDSA